MVQPGRQHERCRGFCLGQKDATRVDCSACTGSSCAWGRSLLQVVHKARASCIVRHSCAGLRLAGGETHSSLLLHLSHAGPSLLCLSSVPGGVAGQVQMTMVLVGAVEPTSDAVLLLSEQWGW